MTHSAVDWLTICITIQQSYWYQNGRTALHNAAHGADYFFGRDHSEVIRLLLDRGADIEAKNNMI